MAMEANVYCQNGFNFYAGTNVTIRFVNWYPYCLHAGFVVDFITLFIDNDCCFALFQNEFDLNVDFGIRKQLVNEFVITLWIRAVKANCLG